MSWLPHPTWLQIIVYGILALVALGFVGTIVFLIAKSMLKCLWLTSWALGRLWARLTGKPLSSHGTAHFADAGEVQASGLLNEAGMPLAQWQGHTLREPVKGHVALVAPPRSHKSWGVIMPVLKEWQGSCVVNDLRGELFEHTHVARESYGPCIRFAPTTKDSVDLNPLDLVRWRQDEMAGDLLRVSTGLLSPAPGEAPTEYQQAAVPFLAALMLDRYAHGEGHLGAVLRFLGDPTRKPQEKMKRLAASPEAMVAHAAGLTAYMSEARLGANLAALANALNVFADPLVSRHTSRSDIDLSELQCGNLPVSLYLCSPFADQVRLRPLWSCLIEQLIARFSAQGQTPRHRVLLCLDEAMNLGKLPELETGMSYLSGCQVQVLMAFQNQRQVKHVYGEFSPILDAIPTTMFYTPEPTDRVTLEEISTALGTTTSVHATRTETRSIWGFFQRETLGEQRHERPLMYPDEIARMSDDACLVLTKGHAPVMALKLDAVPSAVQAAVQQAKPLLKRVAMIAGAVLVAGSVATWALWPASKPGPRLSLATKPPSTNAGATDAKAEGVNASSPTEPDTPSAMWQTLQALGAAPSDEEQERINKAYRDYPGWGDRLTIQPPLRWGLYKEVSPPPWGKPPFIEPEGGGFRSAAACEAALQQRVGYMHQLIAGQKPGRVSMTRVDNGVESTLGPKTTRRETWRCVALEDQPS